MKESLPEKMNVLKAIEEIDHPEGVSAPKPLSTLEAIARVENTSGGRKVLEAIEKVESDKTKI